MIVTFLTNTLSGGGAEKQLLMTAAGLAERGHSCRIYCLAPLTGHGRYTTLINRCRSAGVTMFAPRTSLGAGIVIARLALSLLRGSRSILWTWGFRAEFVRTVCPVLWWSRGVAALRTASNYHVQTHVWMLRLSQFATWRYLANSQRGLDLFSVFLPAVQTRGRVIYNALEPQLFSQPPAALRRSGGIMHVHMLGNILWDVKGYDLALELAQQIQIQGLPIKIHIAGGLTPGERNPAEEIESRGLAASVSWIGKTTEPFEFLAQADAFLLLSRYEGTPNALLEAMAMGIPCIATDVGDLRRFADENAPLTIIPVGDAAAALREVVALWQNPEAGIALGQRGRAFCLNRFSEQHMLDDTEAALKP